MNLIPTQCLEKYIVDEVIELANKLKDKINELPEMKEYLNLKHLLENDKELSNMRKDIARLESLGKTKEKEALLNIYNSHPLVNNYYLAKEEIKSILLTISNIIK